MLRREEGGFTLVELLVAAGLMLIVVGAALALLDSSNTIAARDQERTHAIREAQVGVQSMTRELRQAFSIVSSSPYAIEVHVVRGGADHDVTYDCTGTSSAGPPLGQCVRYETSGSGQGSPRRSSTGSSTSPAPAGRRSSPTPRTVPAARPTARCTSRCPRRASAPRATA